MPAPAIPAMAWMATATETALGVALLLGVFPRLVAALSGILLLTFAVTMALALGIKAPLDASVFSASAGAFLLAVVLSMRSPSPRKAGDSNSPVRSGS